MKNFAKNLIGNKNLYKNLLKISENLLKTKNLLKIYKN